MNEKNSAGIKYFIVVGLSVVCILLILLCAFGLISSFAGNSGGAGPFSFIKAIGGGSFGSGNGREAFNQDGGGGFSFASIPKVVYIIVAAISGIGIFVLRPIRQRLRDEYEYDENGVSRKKGSFSQLSKKERDEIDRQKMIDAERILSSTDVKRITHDGSSDPNKEMTEIIGLNNVKQDMFEMVARIKYEQEHLEEEMKGKSAKERKALQKEKMDAISSMHMVFMGPPGTGKTTVARIMTGFLYETGYIKKNKLIEIDGNFLTGLNPSESTQKTSALILKSLGGVLFIDEAYALANDNCSQEILATLVKEMEDRRGQFILIMAGYDNEMKKMISMNPGIESRVKRYFWFGDYSISDMQQIFIKMAGSEGLTVSPDMMNLFVDRIVYEQKQPNFGNARTVRNLLDKMIDRHAVNMMQNVNSPDEKYTLTAADMPEIDTHKHI